MYIYFNRCSSTYGEGDFSVCIWLRERERGGQREIARERMNKV